MKTDTVMTLYNCDFTLIFFEMYKEDSTGFPRRMITNTASSSRQKSASKRFFFPLTRSRTYLMIELGGSLRWRTILLENNGRIVFSKENMTDYLFTSNWALVARHKWRNSVKPVGKYLQGEKRKIILEIRPRR